MFFLLCGQEPVVALSCDGSVALRQTVCVTARPLQLSRAAGHLLQILHVSLTQKRFPNIQFMCDRQINNDYNIQRE